MSIEIKKLINDEQAAWDVLCAALIVSGAITQDDMEMVGQPDPDEETRGMDILYQIRRWGETVVALRILRTRNP